MPKISVIIPVYNVEKYIKKCLTSLAKQTMQDLELIIVNDGTKDQSEEIIKKFIKDHPEMQIQYFKKENGGLASARNFGVEHAIGEYLSFIDADDYIDQNLYKNLEKYIDQGIDLIKFKMQMVNEQDEIIQKIDGPIFEKCRGEEAYKKLSIQEKYLDPACIYLYKTEFFKQNNFKYQFIYHEDFGLTSLIIIKAKSFVSTDVYGYYYLQSDHSLTRDKDYTKDKLRAVDILKHYDNMIKKIEECNITNETKTLVRRYYTNAVLLKAETMREKDFKEYLEEIKERKMYKNIAPTNIKQIVKRLILKFNIKLYLRLR